MAEQSRGLILTADVTTARRKATPEIVSKLEWLMFFRVVMITLLLGSTLLFRVADADPLLDTTQILLLGLIIGTYALTIIYAVVLKRLEKHFERFAYAQLVLDLLISAVLVAITGGTESLFLIMFSLTILAASILLHRRGAMYMMMVSAMLIVFQVSREALGWWQPGGPVDDDHLLSVFLSGMTNITAVFLVALLAGYLSEQLRDAGQRLQMASRDIEDLRALNGHIITSIQSGLVSFTLDNQIIFFNPAAARITGLDSEDVLYKNVTEVFPVLHLRRPANSRYRWEAEFERPGGTVRTLGYSLSPLREAGGLQRGWILIFRDLTPLRKMEEDVRRAERLAAIGKMAAGIAHEIRNPLASMSGSIEMLAQCVELETTDERLMRIVLREMERLDDLITDFLQFARPNPPQIETLVLRSVFEELLLVFRYLSYNPSEGAGHTPEYDVRLEFDENITVDADPKQFKQVLWNLLNNAAQSMPTGGPINLTVTRHDKEIEVCVIDEGVGIASDIIDRIFDPFFSTKEQGTGLGLAQAQRIVDEHNGRLEVESCLDEGSTFRVFLPSSELSEARIDEAAS